jgi:hypothetical protein
LALHGHNKRRKLSYQVLPRKHLKPSSQERVFFLWVLVLNFQLRSLKRSHHS